MMLDDTERLSILIDRILGAARYEKCAANTDWRRQHAALFSRKFSRKTATCTKKRAALS